LRAIIASVTRQLSYAIQTASVLAFYAFVRLMPLDMASAVSSWLLRIIGPQTPLNQRAVANLRLAYPGIYEGQIRAILAGMWDNLGRVCAEYAHLAAMRQTHRVQVEGGEILDHLRELGGPILFFGAHLANWEAIIEATRQHGLHPCLAYRRFNNPSFERFWRWLQRGSSTEYVAVRAGSGGVRRFMTVLGAGGQALMLADQRMNDGVAIPFFNLPAMTSTALARLSIRFDATLVPMRAERLGGSRFRVTAEAPLEVPRCGEVFSDEKAIMEAVNQHIETWVRARPEQWLWLHRRWPKQFVGSIESDVS